MWSLAEVSGKVGTPYFMSQEMEDDEMYGQSTDVYSYGKICSSVLSKVEKKRIGESLGRVFAKMTILIDECLDYSAQRRPTAAKCGKDIEQILEELLFFGQTLKF